ncbi:unnamed protein product [Calypogeia fissa]
MAFTSKVVFVLLFSSLAWCQDSEQESEAVEPIVKGLKELATLSKNLATKVNGFAMGNFKSEGPNVIQGIENIGKKFYDLDGDLLALLNAPGGVSKLSDPKDKLLKAYKKLVVAVQELRDALIAQYTGLEDFARGLRIDLEVLDDHAIEYSSDLTELCPLSQAIEVHLQAYYLGEAIGDVYKKYNNEPE